MFDIGWLELAMIALVAVGVVVLLVVVVLELMRH